jgi:hypothetical protein
VRCHRDELFPDPVGVSTMTCSFMSLRRFTMPKSAMSTTAGLAMAVVGLAGASAPAFAGEVAPIAVPPASAATNHAPITRSTTSFAPVADAAAKGAAAKATVAVKANDTKPADTKAVVTKAADTKPVETPKNVPGNGQPTTQTAPSNEQSDGCDPRQHRQALQGRPAG